MNEIENDQRLAKRLAGFVDLYGHPWFFRMKKGKRDTGLIGYYGEEQLKSGLVVACDVKGANGAYKRFAYFNSVAEFLAHEAKYPVDERHFYEVIGATTKQQRPYFDIDIPAEEFVGDEIEAIVDAILETLRDVIVSTGDIPTEEIHYVVYETKYPVNLESGLPKKYSYHIVVNGYYFENHEAMRRFGQSVKARIADNPWTSMISNYIDDIWYTTRQFRLAGSSKLGSGAKKEFSFSTDGRRPSAVEGFVTNLEGCRRIGLH